MQADPLEQLRDIHLPEPPNWWPPAPGWWLLVALTLALLAYLAWRRWRRWQAGAPIRHAAALLDSLWDDYQQDADSVRYAHGCNEVLKRLLVGAGLQPDVASASGMAWLQWLDSASASTDFTQGAGQALGEHRFRPQPQVDAAALRDVLARLLERLDNKQAPA